LVSVAVATPLPLLPTPRLMPPPNRAVLLETVTLFMVRRVEPVEVLERPALIPPPAAPAKLPLTVLLLTDIETVPEPSLAGLAFLPPPLLMPPRAVLPAMVSPANVALAEPDESLPPLKPTPRIDTWMPPPPPGGKEMGPAVLPSTWLLVIVREAEPLFWVET